MEIFNWIISNTPNKYNYNYKCIIPYYYMYKFIID